MSYLRTMIDRPRPHRSVPSTWIAPQPVPSGTEPFQRQRQASGSEDPRQPVVLSFRSLKRPDLGLQSVNLRLLLLDLCLLLLHGFHQERSEPGVVDPPRVLAIFFMLTMICPNGPVAILTRKCRVPFNFESVPSGYSATPKKGQFRYSTAWWFRA
jgi:hypothetical protein